jgi:phosphoribosylformylglycinamidine (FGAM) synthase PurS component
MVIDVWYKPGVTDAVGESVMKGIRDLNIPGVKEVRTGMRYHLKGVTRQEIAEKIALALLVNPLVNDSVVHAD